MKRNRFIAEKHPRRYTVYIILIVLCASALIAFAVRHSSSDNYIIPRDVLDSGGGRDTSANYILENSMGQPSPIGESASSHYHLYAGFQMPIGPEPITDLALRDSIVNGDTLYLLCWSPTKLATGYRIYQNLVDPFTDSYTLFGSTTDTIYPVFLKDTLSVMNKCFYRVTAVRTSE